MWGAFLALASLLGTAASVVGGTRFLLFNGARQMFRTQTKYGIRVDCRQVGTLYLFRSITIILVVRFVVLYVIGYKIIQTLV